MSAAIGRFNHSLANCSDLSYNKHMKKFSAVIFSIIAALLAVLSGCGGGDISNPYFFRAMHADITVTAHGKTDEDFKNFCIDIKNTLSSIETSVSVTDENSYISKFNRAAAGEKVELDKCAYDILSLAKQAYEITEGYYNPAVYYSVQAFTKEKNKPFTLPSTEVTEKYKQLADSFREFALEEENGAYYGVKPDFTVEINGEVYSMKLDLGGIAKGYAAKEVERLFQKYGYDTGYVNLGNSSIICKSTKSGGAYTLGMTDPRSQTGASYLTAKIQNANLSTSGDYRNYFIHDGVRYCHIIDPATARPVQTGVTTATIIGGDPALNDAYSTAIMAMGTQKAVGFINANLSGCKVVFICAEGVITNMRAEEYTLNPAGGYSVINTLSADGKIILGDSNVS